MRATFHHPIQSCASVCNVVKVTLIITRCYLSISLSLSLFCLSAFLSSCLKQPCFLGQLKWDMKRHLCCVKHGVIRVDFMFLLVLIVSNKVEAIEMDPLLESQSDGGTLLGSSQISAPEDYWFFSNRVTLQTV